MTTDTPRRPSQREQRRQESREKIIQATIRSVAADGTEGASVRAIIRHAGISRGLIGHHFGNQASLLNEAFQRLWDECAQSMGMAPEPEFACDGDWERALDKAIRGYFEYLQTPDYRQYAWFGFWALARTEPRLAAVSRKMNRETARYFGRLLACAARERGHHIDEKAAGNELWGTLGGAWLNLTVDVVDFTKDDAIRMCHRSVESLLGSDWPPTSSRDPRTPS